MCAPAPDRPLTWLPYGQIQATMRPLVYRGMTVGKSR